MRRLSRNCKRDSGAALLLALWALFLLAGVVFAWALNINSHLTVSATASRELSAEAMASSGAEVALSPTIKPSSANLHRKMGNENYDVQMTGECGRLNLNFLVQGEDPNKLRILRQYLNNKGIDLNDLDGMMDSLLDWVSQNRGLQHLNACPETDDYHPPHAGQLFSVDELKKVCGWEEFTSKPGWDDDFTVVQACGAIDVAYASRDVLRALLAAFGGAGDDRVDAFLQLRQGPDGIDGTADDGVIDPNAVLPVLGVNGTQIQAAGNQGSILSLIQYKTSNVFRIVSVGKSGDVTRTVQMIVQKQQAGFGQQQLGIGQQQVTVGQQQLGVGQQQVAVDHPTVFSWKEL